MGKIFQREFAVTQNFRLRCSDLRPQFFYDYSIFFKISFPILLILESFYQ